MEYLVLVNKKNEIPKLDYKLIDYVDAFKRNRKLEVKTYRAFLKLKEELKRKGIEIGIESGYRTKEYQQLIYDNLVLKKGLNYTKKYVAKPGHSEHETGLVIDICLIKDGKIFIEHDIEDDVWKIIHPLISKYGFILRYPKNKEDITGYKYEPWHIRYVSYPISNEIMNDNITLEEWKMKNA